MNDDLIATKHDTALARDIACEALAKATSTYDALASMANSVSDTQNIRYDVYRVSELLDTLYQMMGISIYDAYGGLRDPRYVKQDIIDLNPQIVLSFEDFMKMSAQENLK